MSDQPARRSAVESVERLRVFELAHGLVLDIYRITRHFPAEERFGMSAQLRRASVSIPSNLSEGARRLTRREYRHFVGVARGSAGEVAYQLRLARDLNYLPHESYGDLQKRCDRVCQMLTRLAQALSRERT